MSVRIFHLQKLAVMVFQDGTEIDDTHSTELTFEYSIIMVSLRDLNTVYKH